jgi:hypothetical protein
MCSDTGSKMNERIKELFKRAGGKTSIHNLMSNPMQQREYSELWNENIEKFAELIVREMCGMMEQAEDDAYHCFEPSERPTEYIEWLNQWRTRFKNHLGVEE